MKKLFLLATMIIGIIGCNKNDDEGVSSNELQGTWRIVDVKRTNGNYASQSSGLEYEAFQCQKGYTFTFEGNKISIYAKLPVYNGYSISCNSQTLYADYKVKGKTIQLQKDGETLDAYVIKSLSDNRLELTFAEQMKRLAKEQLRGYVSNQTNLSFDELLNSTMILSKGGSSSSGNNGNSGGNSNSNNNGYTTSQLAPPTILHGTWLNQYKSGFKISSNDICRINYNQTGICLRSFYQIYGGKLEQISYSGYYKISVASAQTFEFYNVTSNSFYYDGQMYYKQ